MTEYEKVHAELETITDKLDRLPVPDDEIDDLIYKATDLLKTARDVAAER